jgi:4-hydroxythreonine-4-phosphate dehydrogenase
MPRPRLALVPGEPAGVGPELCARALLRDHGADLVVHGDAGEVRAAAARIGLVLPPFECIDIRGEVAAVPGRPDPRNAASVVAALTRAAQSCLDGECEGVVTGPVHKAAINDGGIAFTGTTGLLAAHARRDVVMMLANDIVRVALLTVHLPLRAVADAVTPQALERSLRIVDGALRRDFGIAAPTIAVLGLNPHAGEAGHLGREELEVIEPVLARLRGEGMDLPGPLPADTAFLPGKLRGFDAVLAMYHDQGLPVLKYSDFAHAVNITLGLPYPRVAVDHGTALDLAGSGEADPSSLCAAIAECARMASRRRADAG